MRPEHDPAEPRFYVRFANGAATLWATPGGAWSSVKAARGEFSAISAASVASRLGLDRRLINLVPVHTLAGNNLRQDA